MAARVRGRGSVKDCAVAARRGQWLAVPMTAQGLALACFVRAWGSLSDGLRANATPPAAGPKVRLRLSDLCR